MLKQLLRRPWICPSCLSTSRRGLASLAAAPAHIPHKTRTDDNTIRQIFDSENVWRDFSSQPNNKKAGLLQNRHLTTPQGYAQFANKTLAQCRDLVTKLTTASTVEQYKTFARDFDRLSDLLCRVIDSVEFIRNVHPDSRIQAAATRAHASMYEYMNVLNTSTTLYTQLKAAQSIPEVFALWSEEEVATINILIKDFEQSVINEPEPVRRKFVELSNDIVQLGTEMLEHMAPQIAVCPFNSEKMKGMDPVTVKQLSPKKIGHPVTKIPTMSQYATLALKTVHDPSVRRAVYIASRTADEASVDRVNKLAYSRAKLAELCGHISFAEMTLSDKMARSPAAVNSFLETLAANNKPGLEADLRDMLDEKIRSVGSFTNDRIGDRIEAWDRPYYAHQLRSRYHVTNRPADLLSAYFSLGTVMQGLSRLFTSLYGVHLVPKETPAGETWNDDVRRLDVIDEVEGHIAVLYCDLFARLNKSPNPAHFTLRCSREISATEIEEVSHLLPSNPTLEDYSAALNDGMALSYNASKGTLNQLPTIAFICDFHRPPPGSSRPTLLSFNQVLTLFHEMGHALHSMLGRTALQNVAGTRCATDFAELPSILMEYFAASPAVLSTYARHWETDKPLNVDLVSDQLIANKRFIASQETEAQILLSVLDQRLHSPEVVAGMQWGDWTSTSTYHEVYNDARFSSVSEPLVTSWHGFFGHLYGYGGVYYSYLFDRAIASKLWEEVFKKDPLARKNGQRYRENVLKWGGGRDPWRCVSDVLGKKYAWMREGGPEAMKEVGKWGVGDAGEAGSP